MKVKLKVNKRFQLVVLLTACAACIWMMVVRFGYPVEDLLRDVWVIVVLLVALLIIALPIALLLRRFNSRTDDVSLTPGASRAGEKATEDSQKNEP